jgi:hypothetical protein
MSEVFSNELEQAERAVRELLERIKAGDTTIGPKDLHQADSRVRFPRARVEGEERCKAEREALRRKEEAEWARLERIEQLKERVERELDAAPARIEELPEETEKALADYVAGCVEHDRVLGERRGALSPRAAARHRPRAYAPLRLRPPAAHARGMYPILLTVQVEEIARSGWSCSGAF